MGSRKGLYQVDFPVGTKVRIKPREYLEEFRRTWKFHHPLDDSQLAYGGQSATVLSISSYHGGDELYYLENVPGIWNEPCLEDSD
jgi:hypothetical protein